MDELDSDNLDQELEDVGLKLSLDYSLDKAHSCWILPLVVSFGLVCWPDWENFDMQCQERLILIIVEVKNPKVNSTKFFGFSHHAEWYILLRRANDHSETMEMSSKNTTLRTTL
jgi:hypothetical protein